jgi:2-polyprenyl-3-methyl-5-hydroxy-6-metoxy-1,4-benzoquinol methylase
MKESADIVKEAYEQRKSDAAVIKNNSNARYSAFIVAEREKVYREFLLSHFKDVSNKTFFEIGAGIGGNLNFFNQLGISWNNIYANELLEDRFKVLSEHYPQAHLISGDAGKIKEFDGFFDIVFQSTVFTSILDLDFKKHLASLMWKMKKPDGVILWYDFTFDNPNNKNVKGVKLDELRSLFPNAKQFKVKRVTLAPPIGRRVGGLYSIFNIFPFLRTHLVVLIS